jgi:putative oxidoreductase
MLFGELLLAGAPMEQNKLSGGLNLLGRLLLAALFVSDVWAIVNNYGATQDYLAQFGVPPLLLPPAIVVQLGGGLLIAAGWQTRLAALALGLFCVSTALIFHAQPGDPNEAIHFWKDLALAGGFFVLVAHGAGAYSLDARLRRAGTG